MGETTLLTISSDAATDCDAQCESRCVTAPSILGCIWKSINGNRIKINAQLATYSRQYQSLKKIRSVLLHRERLNRTTSEAFSASCRMSRYGDVPDLTTQTNITNPGALKTSAVDIKNLAGPGWNIRKNTR